MAQQYAQKNGIDLSGSADTFEATTPYQGNADNIEVKVSRQQGFIFGRVLGLDFANVTARAVAEQPVVPGPSFDYAIFSIEDSCLAIDPLMLSGSNISVTGAVHSSSKTEVSGSDNSFTGVMTHRCSFQNSGSNNSYSPLPTQATMEVRIGWNYAFSSFPCTYTYTQNTDLNSRPEAWVGGNPSSNQLNPGVYCSTMDIYLSGQDITGNVTLVAMDAVNISGSDFNLTAYYEGVLAYSEASHGQAIDISGSNGSWIGAVYAPNGTVKFSGSNNASLFGTIGADKIHVSGQNVSIDASYQGPTYGPVSLVE